MAIRPPAPAARRLSESNHEPPPGSPSVRKFDRWGEWHYLTQMFRLMPMMLRRPDAATDFARHYSYGDER